MAARESSFAALVLVLLLPAGAEAEAASQEEKALEAVEHFIQTFNSRDPAAWAASLHYPHVRPSARGSDRVTATAEEYAAGFDFERVVATGWKHSEYDSKQVVQIGPGKAHVAGQYTRYRADGSTIWSNQVTYIVTEADNGWGIQARFAAGFVLDDADLRQERENLAIQAVKNFMTAFNDRDVEAWAATLNCPHVRVASNEVRITPTAQDFVDTFDFESFARTYGWDHSAWDSIEVVQVAANGVNVALQFSRYDAEGTKLSTFDTLYLVTLQDGHWGVRARSSFAP